MRRTQTFAKARSRRTETQCGPEGLWVSVVSEARSAPKKASVLRSVRAEGDRRSPQT